MHVRPAHSEVNTSGFVRRRCRNPRCGGKLRAETDNPRNAFCCRGCFEQYYRKLCLVCERPLRRKAEQQRFCSPKCKFQFRRHQARFLGKWGPPLPTLPGAQRTPPTSARKLGLKTDTKRDRPPRIVAGPAADLHPLNFLPLDPEVAERNRRTNAAYWIDTTPIPGNGWPIVLIGGSDHEHELVHQARQHKSREETP
jgi:hypothetical protein